jgi:hypothetical protein
VDAGGPGAAAVEVLNLSIEVQQRYLCPPSGPQCADYLLQFVITNDGPRPMDHLERVGLQLGPIQVMQSPANFCRDAPYALAPGKQSAVLAVTLTYLDAQQARLCYPCSGTTCVDVPIPSGDAPLSGSGQLTLFGLFDDATPWTATAGASFNGSGLDAGVLGELPGETCSPLPQSDAGTCPGLQACCTDTSCRYVAADGRQWLCNGTDCQDAATRLENDCLGSGGTDAGTPIDGGANEHCEPWQGPPPLNLCPGLESCCSTNQCRFATNDGRQWLCNGADCQDAAKTLLLDCSASCPMGMAHFSSLYARVFAAPVCSTTVGCHGDQPSGGLQTGATTPDLAYSALLAATYDPAAAGTFARRVVPGQPDQSYLWNKVGTPQPVSGSPMPLGGMLPTCDLQDIRHWILNGAPND